MISREVLLKLQKRPDIFFREILGAEAEPYQNKICRTVADNQRIAVSSCHNTGKSWTTARIALWFGSCFPDSKIITTAPTFNQVKNILWSELRSAHAKSKVPLGGSLNLTEWRLGEEWFALGFTPRNELTGGEGQGKASSFQGFHAQGGILVIFDEATGIPPNIWTMAEGLLTQSNVKFLVIGNPTTRNSEFFKCFKSPEWSKIYLNCFDSPNLIANGLTDIESLEREVDLIRVLSDDDAQARMRNYVVKKPHLLSTSWVVGRALKWGVRHPLFVSKVLGKFPEEGDNTLMPLGIIEEAQLRQVYPEDLVGRRKVIGVDVARFGTDSTVLTYIHGNKFICKKVLIKRDTVEVSGAVIEMARDIGMPDVIVIDETGLGGGVVDNLNQAVREKILPYNTEIRGVQFGAAPYCNKSHCDHKTDCDKSKYVNLKARMFDLLAQNLRTGLQLSDDDVYLDELPTILYAYDSKGRMVIESKDDYKKRTGRSSPDHADSLALANYGLFDDSGVGNFYQSSIWDAPETQAGNLKNGSAW